MTKRSTPSSAVWILRIEDQPNGPLITVVSRSPLVAPGVDSVAYYRDVASAITAIAESADQFCEGVCSTR